MAKFDEGVEAILVSYRGAEIMTSFERSTIERLVKIHAFPQPVTLSNRRRGFVKEEVAAWVRARIAGRDAKVTTEERRGHAT